MSAPAAIRAVFAEWRMVKTRKVLALVFEVPLESQGEVLTMLGAPMPDQEIWCAIAKLNLHPEAEPAPTTSARSLQGKARYAAASDMEKALIRAATLPKDERFQKWARTNELGAVDFIRHNCCSGQSRKLIAEDFECYDAFVRMETTYLIESGILPEPR